jgi:hypothetical protein
MKRLADIGKKYESGQLGGNSNQQIQRLTTICKNMLETINFDTNIIQQLGEYISEDYIEQRNSMVDELSELIQK